MVIQVVRREGAGVEDRGRHCVQTGIRPPIHLPGLRSGDGGLE
jgi:hypothetical protein